MPIKAVIFDLFDVLLLTEALTARHAYEQRMGLAENGLLHAMLRSPLFREAIIGHVPASELWQNVARTIGADPHNWQEIAQIFFSATYLNAELVAFIRTLRLHYQTAILSNAPDDVRHMITQRFHLDHEVDIIIISAEEKLHKPQPELYHIAANRLSIRPQEALFIDDESRFIVGAQAIGMHGIQFKDNQQVITEIQCCLEANK